MAERRPVLPPARRNRASKAMSIHLQNLIEAAGLLTRDGKSEARWITDVLRALAAAAQAPVALVALPSGNRWELLRAGSGTDRRLDRVSRTGPPRGLLALALEGRGALSAEDELDPEWDMIGGRAPGRLVTACVPLAEGRRGVLGVWDPVLTDAPTLVLASAAAIGVAIRNRAVLSQLEAEVVTDDLTGTYNYRFLRVALRREVQRAARLGHPLSLCMLDVDHLKEYNERFGHLAGSSVLKQVAAVIRNTTREIDLVAKYGGDEFLLILPHTRQEGAVAAAERVRAAVEAIAFPELQVGEMTCSIGISTFPDHGLSPEVLLAAADEALFAAKRSGRNCVSVAPSARAA